MADERGIDLEKIIIAKIEELQAECNAIQKETSGRYKSCLWKQSCSGSDALPLSYRRLVGA